MAKTAKVTFIIIFLPTLLHDLAASRQVKNIHQFKHFHFNLIGAGRAFNGLLSCIKFKYKFSKICRKN